MKTALILTGSVRTIQDTYHSIKYYLLDRFIDLDVFIYGCENIFGVEDNIKQLESLFNPKKMVINKIDHYTNEIGCNKLSNRSFGNTRYNNSIWAFYNIYQANQLKKEYEIQNGFIYDLVIRTRMDLFWYRQITEEEINIAKNNILIPWDYAFRSGPPWNGPNPFGFSDFYTITNSELFDFYSGSYNSVMEFDQTYPYHPESLLGYYLKDSPVIEVPRHVNHQYPFFHRKGYGNYNPYTGEPLELPEECYHPKVWDALRDFGTLDDVALENLRIRFDKKNLNDGYRL